MFQKLAIGAGLGPRLIRSAVWTVMGFGGSQALRMASNLILTRLLYPEAFGLVALVTVFTVGLSMLSDLGVGPSIQQSSRGDDPAFIDTAWTLQVVRGAVLWFACIPIGWMAALIYGEPLLQWALPVTGVTLLLSGLSPTRIDTANRHLTLGRVVFLELVAQVVGLLATATLAWAMRSVWALIWGGVVGAGARLVLMHWFLPGRHNRLNWEGTAARELVGFGKWIFLSTLCGFLIAQGDKVILGAYLTLDMLGVYNVGTVLAGFAQALASAVMGRVLISMYRERQPGASRENFVRIRRARFALTGSVLALQFAVAFGGVWLVTVLYDDRFAMAGSVVVAVACMNVPYMIGMTYDYAALASGDSRGLFLLLLVKAFAQTSMLLIGLTVGGLAGLFVGVWASQIVVHPMVIWLARRHGAWDVWHDLLFGALGALLTFLALWLNRDALAPLLAWGSTPMWLTLAP